MNKVKLLLTVLIVFPFAVHSQSSGGSPVCGGAKPTWATTTYHEPLRKSYLETVIETGSDYKDVRMRAQSEIERRRKITVGESDAWVKSQPIAEYWECNGRSYTGYFLYQTPNTPKYRIEELEMVKSTNKYPFSARVFVPGMAQIYKGQKTKGALFITGEVLMIGGIVFSEGMRTSYLSKVNSTHNVQQKKAYIDNAATMQNLRNGFIAGAAAVYAWNVIDGIVAKGKPHILIGNVNLKIMPYATPFDYGVGLAVNF